MSAVTVLILAFSVLGALDRILGNRFGLGKEFERGFHLLGTMALTMIGMIVLAPQLAHWLEPLFGGFYRLTGIDPSLIPASLFANDMGGAPLATQVAQDSGLGGFNALVVSSMMGCTVSFTIPFALGIVKKTQHRWLFLGMLCGIVTIPIGCLAGGLVMGLPIGGLLYNLLPLLLLCAALAAAMLLAPNGCVKVFSWLGTAMRIMITLGLSLSLVTFLSGFRFSTQLATLEEGAAICLNASVFMSGAFPLVYVLSKLLNKPLKALGKRMGINETAALGLLSSLATNAVTFEMMQDMDRKGVMLNGAFAVSAAFTFAGHLAFTMAYDAAWLPGVIAGKLIAGVTALAVALLVYPRVREEKEDRIGQNVQKPTA